MDILEKCFPICLKIPSSWGVQTCANHGMSLFRQERNLYDEVTNGKPSNKSKLKNKPNSFKKHNHNHPRKEKTWEIHENNPHRINIYVYIYARNTSIPNKNTKTQINKIIQSTRKNIPKTHSQSYSIQIINNDHHTVIIMMIIRKTSTISSKVT